MKTKNNCIKTVGYLTLMVITFLSCSEPNDEFVNRVSSPSFSSLVMSQDVSFSLMTEMTLSSKVMAFGDNQDCVSEVENQLRFKKSMDCKLFFMVKNDGAVDADIKMADFGLNPKYPTSMIGCNRIDDSEKVERIEIRDGHTTIFNRSGEVLNSISQKDTDVQFYVDIIDNIKDQVDTKFSPEQWDIVEEAFIKSGYDIIDRSNSNRDLNVAMNRNDGGRSEIALNRELGFLSGTRHYDINGVLTTARTTIYNTEKSTKWEDRIDKEIFVIPYISPFTDCEMAIIKEADYKKIEFTLN
jgi:hypothetical protein